MNTNVLEKTFVELKVERLFNALIRNYINDGYRLTEYTNLIGGIGIEAYLSCRSNSNELRLTVQFEEHVIYVYKNRKLNNKVNITL